ncbi:hypothetical protein [Inquilinus sp. Marseille-Q2685]|uniref:hypothetical protein n=1 Tax=Inquilinus sp. Marseille-Q2685 TaxID=2866581 RepID=UPI001CE3CEE2|nr:hypothetical protein [Inquilinus sp. Marseille-Q2685]
MMRCKLSWRLKRLLSTLLAVLVLVTALHNFGVPADTAHGAEFVAAADGDGSNRDDVRGQQGVGHHVFSEKHVHPVGLITSAEHDHVLSAFSLSWPDTSDGLSEMPAGELHRPPRESRVR